MNITVNLTLRSGLKNALRKAGVKDPALVTKLAVTGAITKDHFAYIRKNMAETLRELDLGKASPEDGTIGTYESDSIDEWWFVGYLAGCTGLTAITLPDTLTKISHEAFEDCTGLTSISIPASTVEIECGAFSGCSGLTEISVHPDNPEYASVNGVLFSKDKTELIIYPEGRQGDYAIPDSVADIGRAAFSECSGLTAISISPDNPDYISEDGVLYNRDKTGIIAYPAGRQGDYAIPDTVTKVGFAFHRCAGLTAVHIPETFENIDTETFKGCTALAAISVHPDNPLYASEDGVLFNRDKTVLISMPDGRKGDYAVPASVRKIDFYAFKNCTGLTSVYIPESVREIEESAFWHADALTAITAHPDNPVYTSVNGAVYNKEMTRLIAIPGAWQRKYAVPDSITKIDRYFFSECSVMLSVIIPASVTKIHKWAFFRGRNLSAIIYPMPYNRYEDVTFCDLTEISVHPDNPNYSSENGVLFNRDKTKILVYPQGREESHYAIPVSVTKIGNEAFACCDRLKSLTIPNSVKKIGDGAFHRIGLTSVAIPDSVTEIGDRAFYECKELKSVIISDSVKKIGDSAFHWCNRLKSVVIPDSVTEIGNDAFSGCYGLASVTLSASLTKIGNGAFSYGGFKSVIIPDSVKSIDVMAFYNSGLTSIFIPASVTDFAEENPESIYHVRGVKPFACCKDMTDITVHPDNPNYSSEDGVLFNRDKTVLISMPDGRKGDYAIPATVTKIPVDAFDGCGKLKSITIPSSVTQIGNRTFAGCKGITSIKIPDSVTEIGYEAFDDCSAITSVTVPASVTKIGQRAFSGSKLTAIMVHRDNPNYTGENGVLFNRDKTRLILYPQARQGDYVIPASVTVIGEEAFHGCKGLTAVTIPDSVKKIEEDAFYDCSGLTSVTVPASVNEICKDAISGCDNMTSIAVHPDNPAYSSEDGVLFNRDKTELIQFPRGKGGDYTIPDSVIKIGSDAFKCCLGLETLTIPASVVNVEDSDFRYCTFDIEVHPDNPVYKSKGRELERK